MGEEGTQERFDTEWKIYATLGIDWSDIKKLSVTDRVFLMEKADEVKDRMEAQRRAQQSNIVQPITQ